MGAEDNRPIGTESTGHATSGAAGEKSNRNSTTDKERTGTATKGRTSGGQAEGNKSDEAPDKVDDVKPLPQINVPKKRGRKPKNEEVQKFNTDNIEILISTISVIISSRKGLEYWLLTPEEVKTISNPLNNILKDNKIIEKLGNNADKISLLMALITILTPRIIKMINDINSNKKLNNEVKKQVERQTGTNDIGNSKRTARTGSNTMQELLYTI